MNGAQEGDGGPPGIGRGRDRAVALWIDRVALVAGGAALASLLGLTVVDVVLRYGFGSPLFGAQDVGELLLVVVVAISFAYAARRGAHVTVDVASFVLGAAADRRLARLGQAIAASLCALAAWRAWVGGHLAALFNETTLLLGLPLQPMYYVLSAGLALAAVGFAAAAGRGLWPERTGRQTRPDG